MSDPKRLGLVLGSGSCRARLSAALEKIDGLKDRKARLGAMFVAEATEAELREWFELNGWKLRERAP